MSKFIPLTENFSWLIAQLKAFDDPNITYSYQGRKDIRGGERRIYRDSKHYQTYYQGATIVKSPSPIQVNFGTTQIEVDEWDITHPKFNDKELKEKYPKPDTHYTVLVTSRNSLKNHTATRYYVSCDCMDQNTTFKEKLIQYGYTNGTVLPGTGKKKLGSCICKHIYAVLMREYSEFIKEEPGTIEAADEMPWTYEEPEQEYEPYEPSMPEVAPETEQPVPPGQLPIEKAKRGRIPKTTAQKKAEYELSIKRSLKFFNNIMPNNVDVYKNSRQTDNSYRKYKFMIKKYFQGYVIVFTNPLLNPLRDKVKEKEIMPMVNRTAKGMVPAADSIVVYTKYFTKDELMNMIKSETREIQQNQIDKLNKTVKTYTLTEALEVLDADSSQILTLLLGLY